MKRILVTGTSRPFDRKAIRAAHLVGVTLARSDFGLITGNTPGVDRAVASAFCFEADRLRRRPSEWFTQIALPFRNRGSLLPFPGFKASPECTVKLKTFFEWLEEVITRGDAAIMIGGHLGALRIARRLMDMGKPVFAIPFTGGRSGEVFQDILKTWHDTPVPGLTRTQFLRLSLPWISGTGPLANLLRGTLAETPEIFISYRRADSDSATGRLYHDLVEHFGTRRVFMDMQHIEPSHVWKDRIDQALECCKIGIIVIGRRWLEPLASTDRARLFDEDDVVRLEIRSLLNAHKIIIPILVEGGRVPESDRLPPDVKTLPMFQARTLDNSNWDVVLTEIVKVIDNALRSSRSASQHPV